MVSVSLPSAVDMRHDLVEVVLRYRETRDRESEGVVGCTVDCDHTCCTSQRVHLKHSLDYRHVPGKGRSCFCMHLRRGFLGNRT